MIKKPRSPVLTVGEARLMSDPTLVNRFFTDSGSRAVCFRVIQERLVRDGYTDFCAWVARAPDTNTRDAARRPVFVGDLEGADHGLFQAIRTQVMRAYRAGRFPKGPDWGGPQSKQLLAPECEHYLANWDALRHEFVEMRSPLKMSMRVVRAKIAEWAAGGRGR